MKNFQNIKVRGKPAAQRNIRTLKNSLIFVYLYHEKIDNNTDAK